MGPVWDHIREWRIEVLKRERDLVTDVDPGIAVVNSIAINHLLRSCGTAAAHMHSFIIVPR